MLAVLLLWLLLLGHETWKALFQDYNGFLSPMFSVQCHCFVTYSALYGLLFCSTRPATSNCFSRGKPQLNSTQITTLSLSLSLVYGFRLFWWCELTEVLISRVGCSIWGEGKARFNPTKLPQQMQWLPPLHGSSSAYSAESKPTSAAGFNQN